MICKVIGQRVDISDCLSVGQCTGHRKFRDFSRCSYRHRVSGTACCARTHGICFFPNSNCQFSHAKKTAYHYNSNHKKNNIHFIFPFPIKSERLLRTSVSLIPIINTCSIFVNRTFTFFRKNVRFLFITFFACPLIMEKG